MERNTQRAVMIMGIQGIGKSTWCRERLGGDEYHTCCKDDLRFLVYPNDRTWEETYPHERVILSMHQDMINVALDLGKIPVVDETHASKKHRMGMLDFLKYHNRVENVEIHVFELNLKHALYRNAKREGKRCVPEEAIAKTYDTLMSGLNQPRNSEELKQTLLDEGFDKVVLTYEME